MKIDAKELQHWSDLPPAQSDFPFLISRLVFATVNSPFQVKIPGGSGIHLPGFDGVIESEGGPFIPSGMVVMELSVRSDIKTKADEDFKTRTEDHSLKDKCNITYVFISSRIWKSKEKWREDKLSLGVWKNILVYDANDLIQWLGVSEVVQAWFARLIGKIPDVGAITLADWWEQWVGATRPRILPSLITAGRELSVKDTLHWVQNEGPAFYIQGDTVEEAIAFFASCCQQGQLAEAVFSRAVVVTSIEAWIKLSKNKTPLILIPLINDDLAIGEIGSKGHRVLFSIGKGDSVKGQGTVLPRTKREPFLTALQEMELSRVESEALARATGRHLPSVRRRLIERAGGAKPIWATALEAENLIPALLLGQWTENEDDLKMIAALTKVPVEDLLREYQKLLHIPDSPIKKLGNNWRLTSHEEAWAMLSPFLVKSDLEKFSLVADEVLAEISPALDLEDDKRFMAAIYGKTPRFSGVIREGIVETMVLMSTRAESLESYVALAPKRIANKLFVNHRDNWKFWATQGSLLANLSEAVPEILLSNVEEALNDGGDVFLELFQQEGDDAMWGRCYHSGLLWALERLAWAEEYFSRVAVALAKLSQIDPGGRFANRPAASLKHLFVSWIRFSEASDEIRIRVLQSIIDKYEKVGWDVLLKVAADFDDTVELTDTPHWRSWGQDIQRPTMAEANLYKSDVLNLLKKSLGQNSERWSDILGKLSYLESPDDAAEVIKKLETILITEKDLNKWYVLRDIIRRKLHLHRNYSDQNWAFPKPIVAGLQRVYDLLETSNPVTANSWLFDNWPDLPEKGRKNEHAANKRLKELQVNSIIEICNYGGEESIRELITTAPNSLIVGDLLFQHNPGIVDLTSLLIESLLSSDKTFRYFADGVLNATYRRDGWPPLASIISKAAAADVGTDSIASIYLAAKPERRVWEILSLDTEDVQKGYWSNLNVYSLAKDNFSEYNFAISKLIDYGKTIEVVQRLAYSDVSLDKVVLVRALEVLPKEIENCRRNNHYIRISADEISKMFERLDALETDVSVITRLEAPYIKILQDGPRQLKIHGEVIRDPAFFTELISWRYKRLDGQNDNVGYSEGERAALADAASHVLDHIELNSRSDEKGSIDFDLLTIWIEEALSLCEKMGRLRAGRRTIGRLLSTAPIGKDRVWPCEEVRIILERFQSTDLGEHFVIGKKNLHSFTTRSPNEGGKQEREKAKKYIDDAAKLTAEFPFTAKLLRRLAEDYNYRANLEDLEAEWDDR